MHIVFHCVTDTALATPLKLEHVMSAKKLMPHAVQISQGIYKCTKKYTRNNFLWEQFFERKLLL